MVRLCVVLFLVLVPVLAQPAPDEPAAPWAREAVELLVSKGIFIGYPDGTFRWREPLTRQEAALALYRLLAAYGLDQLSPEEVEKLLEAVKRLQEELPPLDEALKDLQREQKALEERLKELEGKPQADTRPLEEALRQLEERLKALEEAQKGLAAAQKALEAKALDDALKKAQEEAQALERRVQALEAKPQADPAELTALRQAQAALQEEVATLRQAQAAQAEALKSLQEALQGLPEARRLAEEAQRRLNALEPRVQTLEEGLKAQAERLSALEGRLKALEERQAADEARIKALEDQVALLQRTLTPVRRPFYLGLAAYRGDVTGDWFGRILLGHDALLGPLGLRLAYEAPFADLTQGLVSLDLTFRASYGDLDGYFGVGGGVYLDTPPFGQILIGAGFRLFPFFSLFVEGHQRYLFDGQASQRSTLAFGLAVRF